MRTYVVLEDMVAAIEASLAKRIKQAEKQGWALPSWKLIGTSDQLTADGYERWVTVQIDVPMATGNWVPMLRVDHRKAQADGLDTWANEIAYLADVDFDIANGDTDIVRQRKQHLLGLVDAYRRSPPHCDHCGKTRQRNETFVGMSIDGNLRQFGKTCLSDATGVVNVDQMIGFLELLHRDIQRVARRKPRTASDMLLRSVYVPVLPFLSLVAMMVHERGWVSQNGGRNSSLTPTWKAAYEMLRTAFASGKNGVTVAQQDIDLAKDALAWIQTAPLASNFAFNVKRLADQDTVSVAGLPTLAALITLYKPPVVQAAPQVVRVSQHVGRLNEYTAETVVVTHCFRNESVTWPSYCIHARTRENNVVVWFDDHMLTLGKEYKITGFVKQHTAFRNVLQTLFRAVKQV